MESQGTQQVSVTGSVKAGRRSARRRRQPYAWLGASALTLGVGVALAGAGTAHADDSPSVDSARSAKGSASSAPASRGPVRRAGDSAADSTPGDGSSSSATSAARSAGSASRGDAARPARVRSAAVRTATAAANASSAASASSAVPAGAAAPAGAATTTARSTDTMSSRVRGATARNIAALDTPGSGLAYATYPAAPLNPRDYGPLLGALVRLSNEIQYVTADQKPSLSPVQLPSAPSQTLVAGSLNAYSTSGAPFSVAVTGQPTNGIVTIDSSSGSYVYTPNAELAAAGGTDTFTITATDTGFHPLAALLGQPAHATTVTVPVTVAVASPAGTTGTTAYYVTNTSYKTMQVAYYDNNGASLSPAAGTTLATGESTEFQIPDGNSVTVHFNPADVSHQGVIQAYGANLPYGVAVSPDGKTIYSVETSSSYRSVLTFRDIQSGLVAASVELHPSYGHTSSEVALAATPDGTRVYTVDSTGNVSVVSVVSKTVTGTVSLRYGGVQIALSPDGKKAYITGGNGSQAYVSVLDTDPSSASYNSVVAEVNVGGGAAVGVAVNPSGTKAYVTVNGKSVSVIDTGTNTVSASIPVNGAAGVAVSPDGNIAYVASLSAGLAVIDTATNTIKTTVGGLSNALVVAVRPDGKHVYVGSEHLGSDTGGTFYYPSSDSYLYDINAVTYEVASPITMVSKPGGDFVFPTKPTSLAIAPDGKSVWAGMTDGISSGLVAQVAVITDGTISDNGVTEYTVSMSGGSGSCSAKGTDQCVVTGTSTYLEDPPGTVYIVPNDQAQQQSDVLQNLAYDDTSNATFSTKSKATIGYTNPLIPQGYMPTTNIGSTPLTTTFLISVTTSQADATTYGVSVKAGADVKLGVLTAKAEGTYTATWGTTITNTTTTTQSWTQTVNPGYKVFLYTESPVQRFYGDWAVQYGNTTYYLANVWYDTPYPTTTGYPVYVVAGDCVDGSTTCEQLKNGDTSALNSGFPSSPTYVVAESESSSSYTASSSSVYATRRSLSAAIPAEPVGMAAVGFHR